MNKGLDVSLDELGEMWSASWASCLLVNWGPLFPDRDHIGLGTKSPMKASYGTIIKVQGPLLIQTLPSLFYLHLPRNEPFNVDIVGVKAIFVFRFYASLIPLHSFSGHSF